MIIGRLGRFELEGFVKEIKRLVGRASFAVTAGQIVVDGRVPRIQFQRLLPFLAGAGFVLPFVQETSIRQMRSGMLGILGEKRPISLLDWFDAGLDPGVQLGVGKPAALAARLGIVPFPFVDLNLRRVVVSLELLEFQAGVGDGGNRRGGWLQRSARFGSAGGHCARGEPGHYQFHGPKGTLPAPSCQRGSGPTATPSPFPSPLRLAGLTTRRSGRGEGKSVSGCELVRALSWHGFMQSLDVFLTCSG